MKNQFQTPCAYTEVLVYFLFLFCNKTLFWGTCACWRVLWCYNDVARRKTVRFLFFAPAVARCDIGVRFSVRPSVRPQFTSTLAFKSIQLTFSLKPLHPWILNFICSKIRLQGFRIVKFSVVENSRWPQLLKIAKLLKNAIFSKTARYIWLKFCMTY